MLRKNSVKAVNSNAFKAAIVGISGVALVMSLTACSPINSLKSTYEGQPFPQMPSPEVATYVLDLSGSTNPAAQLEALGSGITDFIAGQSLGNPFAQTPVGPRGLSIQFVTRISAQAPRILLVSANSGANLYDFVKENTPNLEGARQLWDGLINARKQIWQDSALQANSAECINQVIKMLGRQQLLPAALREPSNMICQDAKQSNAALKRLKEFVSKPSITMGSDVEGAVLLSLKNLETARSELNSAHLTLVIASDLVDEVSLSLSHRLPGRNSKEVCAIANKDSKTQNVGFQDVNVVIVGARNSKYAPKLLDQVHSYWSCYFAQIGITNINEQSDLSGF